MFMFKTRFISSSRQHDATALRAEICRKSKYSTYLFFQKMEERMLMFPYILNLLAAMLLALIGAERQWRQRMADYALMRWWAHRRRRFYSEPMTTRQTIPRENCGRLSLRWLSGAGVIMREGMNVRD